MFDVIRGNWLELKSEAHAIRHQVFVVEQQVDESEEWDDMDEQCIHFIARDNTGKAAGTARLLPDGHIGRMAVLADYRGFGVGTQLMREALAAGLTAGYQQFVLHAQTHAIDFYSRFGFQVAGDEFDEAGIPHIKMILTIDP